MRVLFFIFLLSLKAIFITEAKANPAAYFLRRDYDNYFEERQKRIRQERRERRFYKPVAPDDEKEGAIYLQNDFACTEDEYFDKIDGQKEADQAVKDSVFPVSLIEKDKRAAALVIELMRAHYLLGMLYYLRGDLHYLRGDLHYFFFDLPHLQGGALRDDILHAHTELENGAYSEEDYNRGFTKPVSYFAYSRYVLGGFFGRILTDAQKETFFKAQEELIQVSQPGRMKETFVDTRPRMQDLRLLIEKIYDLSLRFYEEKYGVSVQDTTADIMFTLASEAVTAYNRALKCPRTLYNEPDQEAYPINMSGLPAYEEGYVFIVRAIALFEKNKPFFKEKNIDVETVRLALKVFERAFPSPLFPEKIIVTYSQLQESAEILKRALKPILLKQDENKALYKL